MQFLEQAGTAGTGSVTDRAPDIAGKSKKLWDLGDGTAIAELIPTLRSYTHNRDEVVPGTAELRLDFYEMAVGALERGGVRTAFITRLGPNRYLTRLCTEPPVEVIVKNRAYGSTLRKYPGLYEEGQAFRHPIVKFDYRTEPEDEPIAADYVREIGWPADEMRALALRTNTLLREWLAGLEVIDFCVVFGSDAEGDLCITSEVSPDAFRIRGTDGSPLDKDLFRQGHGVDTILERWKWLVRHVGASS